MLNPPTAYLTQLNFAEFYFFAGKRIPIFSVSLSLYNVVRLEIYASA